MDRSIVVSLVNVSYSTDSMGQKTQSETKTDVFGEVKSITRAEWSAAGQLGLKPEYRVTLFEHDYNGQEIVELVINGSTQRFGVYRTYLSKNETIELYLEKKGGV